MSYLFINKGQDLTLSGNINDNGLILLALRFIQNRKTHYIYLRKYIPHDDWIEKGHTYVKERGGSIPNPKELNSFLRSLLARVQKILLEAEQSDKPISFRQFKAKVISTEVQDFIIFCEEELKRRSVSGKYSKETIKSNTFKLNKLKGFRETLTFFELTVQFLDDYETYLRVERKNDVNTIHAAMKFIRNMLNSARRMKLTEVYPFEEYKLVYKKDTRDRLNLEEINTLQQLYDSKTLNLSLKEVLRLFLFSAYTGLSWGDLETLEYEHIQQNGNDFIIYKNRKKTGISFIVPLIEQSRNLVDLSKKNGMVFPDIMSNQKANAYIKKIIQQTNIRNKQVSFHVGRHSFASIAINNKIPKEVIKKILGHSKNSSITDLYAKVQDDYIIDEMRKLDHRLSNTTFKDHFSDEVLGTYKKLRAQLIASRITEGYSELDAAKVIGVSEQEYQQMEKGEVQFGLVHWVALQEWLGVGSISGM